MTFEKGNDYGEGHPKKLSKGLMKEICGLLARPTPVRTVCDLVMISHTTFYNWKNRGKDVIEKLQTVDGYELDEDDKLYMKFYLDTSRARRAGEMNLSGVLIDAARAGNSADARWLLERMYPENWTGRQELDINHSAGSRLEPEAARDLARKVSSDDELRGKAGELLDAMIELEREEKLASGKAEATEQMNKGDEDDDNLPDDRKKPE